MADWYADAIDEVERCAQELHSKLEHTMDALRAAREERLVGVSLPEIVANLAAKGGRARREAPDLAFRDFQRAVTAYRAAAIRALVDEHQMSFSELATLTGVSRQMVSRLYQAASTGGEAPLAPGAPSE